MQLGREPYRSINDDPKMCVDLRFIKTLRSYADKRMERRNNLCSFRSVRRLRPLRQPLRQRSVLQPLS